MVLTMPVKHGVSLNCLQGSSTPEKLMKIRPFSEKAPSLATLLSQFCFLPFIGPLGFCIFSRKQMLSSVIYL